MHRSLVLLVVVALGFAATLLSPSNVGAAPTLYLSGQSCSDDGKLTLSFRWEATSADAQQILLELHTDGTDVYSMLDVTTATDNRIDAPGQVDGSYVYARLHQVLSDGTWESSTPVGFQQRSCGVKGQVGDPPVVLGFSTGMNPDRTRKALTPEGGTLLRSCGQDYLYVYLRHFVPSLSAYRWYIDGELQTVPTPRGYIDDAGIFLKLPLGSARTVTGSYSSMVEIRFRSDPPATTSITLTC